MGGVKICPKCGGMFSWNGTSPTVDYLNTAFSAAIEVICRR